MPRFLVFGWHAWDSAGGWNDFVAACDTLDAAVTAAREALSLADVTRRPDVVQVVDLSTLSVVSEIDRDTAG